MKRDPILIIACESSAENYGADLVQKFQKVHPSVHFYGIGGKQMKKQGVELLFSIQDLSFIGLFEIVFYIPRILRVLNEVIKETKKRNSVAAVLIDSPDFNLRVAKKLNKLSIPILYYIGPTVWAWRKNRLKTIQKRINKMMLIFPFEEKIYRNQHIPAAFIGHPLVKKARVSLSRQQFFQKYGINNTKRLITLLPGSRKSEVKFHLPILIKAINRIKKKYNCQFFLKLSDNIEKMVVESYLKDHSSSIKILKQDGYESVAYSDLVLSACGTANLEAALLETPLISFYRISPLSYLLGKKFIKIKNFSIVNIIAEKKVIPELIQKDFNPKSVFEQASKILDSFEIQDEMIDEFKKIKKLLGNKDASTNAARELKQLIS